jgi:hypothetical protein
MATTLLGTGTTTSLVSLAWNPASAVADVATIAAHIKGQANPSHPISPGAFSKSGRLHFPGRLGFVCLKPGDVVAYDHYGWPIFVSTESIAEASSSWVLT